ncbi:hypothetical protein BU26DRAFT_516625 [Trematosphaeria pertusa]|uniref:BTB domain-containing protein n=1 Tax=Trematosphaeria pertusa TaxID=390896 RepID=A0A6A6INB8_9PLEO|nr:uncharacterized protein BU26DRAFT_516625 [Trematosphaeria pertusa]KAF2251886.1 hypothetical protein BU26DRAFT_516625 [Trematosphaeria pertusa]
MPFMNPKGMSTLGHTFRNFDQTILTVKVGKGDCPESFSCHRELLRRCSAYFDRALQQQSSSPYKTGDSALELEDTNPDVFDAFMMWLYTGHIPHHLIEGGKEVQAPTHSINLNGDANGTSTPDQSDDVDAASWGINLDSDDTPVDGQQNGETTPAPENGAEKIPGDGESEKSGAAPPTRLTAAEKPDIPKETLCPCCSRPYKWRGLEGFLERRFIALYVFAHRYEIPKLRRDVIVAWQTNDEILQSMPDHDNVITAYESLPPDSPLCRYFLDMYTVYWDPAKDNERMIALRSQLPQAFLFELATALAKGERPKTEKEWCEWHEHEDEAAKKACLEEMVKDPAAAKAMKRIKDTKGWKGLVLKKGKR